MANITGLVTATTSKTVDPIADVAGTTRYKQAKGARSATGLDSSVAGQVVHFDSNTATLSNVSDTNASTTILAANSARVGAMIWNDSTAVLYLKLGGGTASATSCTVKLIADAYYELPYGFTGAITGIWASDASGAARITEITSA